MHNFNTLDKTRVVIYNPIGSVDLHATGSGTASVELLPRGSDADEIVEGSTVTCAETNGVSVITVTFPNPRSLARRRSSVDVQITAPERCDVSVSTTGPERSLIMLSRGDGGDIRLRGTVGDVDVTVPSADLSAQAVAGSLTYKSASGDLDVDTVAGPLKIRSVSGDVTIDETSDDASITLVSGDVSITTARKHVDVTSVSGDVTLTDVHDGASGKSTSGDVVVRRAWSGAIRAATVSGDVTVGIPSGRGVSVDARSMSGDLSSEIDLSQERDEGSGGGDVVRITAHSVSGDVEILRASAPATA